MLKGKAVSNWFFQRFSAVISLPCFVFFLGCFLSDIKRVPLNSSKMHLGSYVMDTAVSHPFAGVAFLILLFSIFVHGYIGIMVVVNDYIQSLNARILIKAFLLFFIILTFFSASYSVVFLYQPIG